MLKLYNTLTKKKEILKPFDKAQGKKLNLFVCGITPYDFAHLGHARTYVLFDAFVKYLRNSGYKVFYLQNVTDVDDKIIKKARDLGKSWKQVSKTFEKEYLNNMRVFGVNSVDKYARATEHIPEIISQVKQLLKKGYAYEVKNDGIYYDISKFKRYGQLARRTKEQADDAVSRIDESTQKRNKGDFALWKLFRNLVSQEETKFLPAWKSPWGPGRPGWHIEDTAITEKYFGPQYDIHGGGIDLIFPHHEAEIAQMEAISDKKPLVRHWMHTGFLTIQGEKMSKSLGNFITIKDFLKRHSPRVLRLLFLKTHYRSPIDYSEKLILQTERELQRIDEFVDKLKSRTNTNTIINHTNSIREIRARISEYSRALEDDFSTPKAIAAIFDLIAQGNTFLTKGVLSIEDVKSVLCFLQDIDEVFGFVCWGRKKQQSIPTDITKLVKQREIYRIEKKWAMADEVRKRILQKGWVVDDTPTGSHLKKV